jgi:hypothetical protein
VKIPHHCSARFENSKSAVRGEWQPGVVSTNRLQRRARFPEHLPEHPARRIEPDHIGLPVQSFQGGGAITRAATQVQDARRRVLLEGQTFEQARSHLALQGCVAVIILRDAVKRQLHRVWSWQV